MNSTTFLETAPMNSKHFVTAEPREVLHLLATYWRRWLVPAALVAGLATAYAVLVPPTWQALQALILRNEATNAELGPGKFARTDEMKTVQETILELAKSRGVLLAALQEVGPPADYADKDGWASEQDVDTLRQAVKLAPPKGAEFGATEVFYLDVRDPEAFLTMMRLLGAYRVGHAADGGPLVPPARLLKPGADAVDQQKTSAAEGVQP
jgi:hypothetical protein